MNIKSICTFLDRAIVAVTLLLIAQLLVGIFG